jgi:hypothetical protein
MSEPALPLPRDLNPGAAVLGPTDGTPTKHVIKARRGTTFRCIFESQDDAGNPSSLVGLHARLYLGERGGPALLSLDTAVSQNRLVLADTAGTITLCLGATYTKTMPVGPLQFDLDLYDPNDPEVVEPFATGTIVVTPEVGE